MSRTGEGRCMRPGCGGPLIEIDRRQQMREQMALKQRMTEELRVLEELVQVCSSGRSIDCRAVFVFSARASRP